HLIASPLIVSKCLIKPLVPRECCINCLGQEFSIPKGVCYALSRNRIFVATCISYQRPAWTIRLAEEVRQFGCAHKAMYTFSITYSPGKIRSDLIKRLQKVLFEVGPESMEFLVRPLHEDSCLIVISWKCDNRALGPCVELKAIYGNTAPIGVITAGSRRCRSIHRGVN